MNLVLIKNIQQVEKLYTIPGVSLLVYKQLSQRLQFLLASAAAALLPQMIQVQERQKAGEAVTFPLLDVQDFVLNELSQDEQDMLQSFQLIRQSSGKFEISLPFLQSLDKAFGDPSGSFTLVQARKESLMIMKTRQLQTISLAEIPVFLKEAIFDPKQLERKLLELQVLNLSDKDFAFGKIVYLILNIQEGGNADNYLRRFMEILKITGDGPLVKRFILGDPFVQARIILQQLIALLGDQQSYKVFSAIVEDLTKRQEDGLAPRVTQNQQGQLVEQQYQLQFLLQLIAMPPRTGVIIEEKFFKPFRNVVYFLERLGLIFTCAVASQDEVESQTGFTSVTGVSVVSKPQSQMSVAAGAQKSFLIVLSDLLSLQQYDTDTQLKYHNFYGLHVQQQDKPLLVESTGRVTYYKCGDIKDKLYASLLRLFAHSVYDLQFAEVFQLDENIIRDSQAEASLVARFLVTNSEYTVPADLINLLETWVFKSTVRTLGAVAVFSISQDPLEPVISRLLYVGASEKLHEKKYIRWEDVPYLRKIQQSVELMNDVIYGKEISNRDETEKAIQELAREAEVARLFVVPRDAAKDVEEIIKTVHDKLQTTDYKAKLQAFLRK